MTQQFTASEVRGQIAWLRNVTVVGTKTTYQMLDAFADLLEAQEKAVPVATVVDQFGFPLMEWIGDAGDRCSVGTKLYTHPSPADAERLAEALRQAAQSLRTIERSAMREEGLEDAENVRAYARSRADVAGNALAAHSAQAQPPAVSVTDAMVQRAFDKLLADGLDDLDRPKIEGMRAALESALAAQENPNG